MVRRIADIAIAPVAVICVGLWVAGGAAGQSVTTSSLLIPSKLVPSTASSRSEDLPDSPSVQAASLKKFDEMNGAGAMRPNEFASFDGTARSEPKTIFDKYLSRRAGPVVKVVDPNANAGLVGRATHAAVGVFVTRDEMGRNRINSSYFFRAMAAVAADTASKPYWRRSPGDPLADFGSTVGNDAGLNVLHAFEPGLQQMVKSHTPRFVARIAERVAR
jgi:hypothetical protein